MPIESIKPQRTILSLFFSIGLFLFPNANTGHPSDRQGHPVLPGVIQAQPESKKAGLDPLRDLLAGFVERQEAPGVSLVLVQHGCVVLEEAYGWADIEGKKPFTTDTIASIASTTKPLSATSVMILVDEGKIALDDPVSKYLPAYGRLKMAETETEAPSPTIRQLLSHTSGMFGLREATPSGRNAIRNVSLTLSESVDLIAREELLAEPGRRFSYGGASFQVAGRIVEIVSGMPFDLFMEKRVLKPLGMMDTFFRPNVAQGKRIANIYRPVRGELQILRRYNPQRKVNLIRVGGGLYSTPGDLAVFLQMHLNDGLYGSERILSPSAVAEMQEDQTGKSVLGYSPYPNKKDYGLGWFRDRIAPRGQALSVSHAGMSGSIAWIDKERDLVGVLFAPVPLSFSRKLHKTVREKILELFPHLAQSR